MNFLFRFWENFVKENGIESLFTIFGYANIDKSSSMPNWFDSYFVIDDFEYIPLIIKKKNWWSMYFLFPKHTLELLGDNL